MNDRLIQESHKTYRWSAPSIAGDVVLYNMSYLRPSPKLYLLKINISSFNNKRVELGLRRGYLSITRKESATGIIPNISNAVLKNPTQ